MVRLLVCTNQARMNNVVVDDIPTTLDYNNRWTHSLYFPDHDVRLHLQIHGPMSYLVIRYLAEEELECWPNLDLTSHDEWDQTCIETLEHGATNISSFSIYFKDKIMGKTMFKNIYQRLINTVNISATSRTVKLELTAEVLVSNWNINVSNTKQTLQATTKQSVTIKHGHIRRRVKTTPHHLRYRHLTGYLDMFCSDTFTASVNSLWGNKFTRLFRSRGNFTKCCLIKKKNDAHHTLDSFIHDIGIPEEMLTNNAKELHVGEWDKTCKRWKIRQLTTEPNSPWQNHAELVGGIVNKVRHLIKTTNTPILLWDYC